MLGIRSMAVLAVHPIRSMHMGRCWRIRLAVKVTANVHQADVRGCYRGVLLYLHVTLDLAKPRQAGRGIRRIPLALEIAVDDDVRPLKAVRPGSGALLDLHISADCDIALEQSGGALGGLDIASDR